jgi:DHA3 family macrolide efflux protein-like MFS transporter
MATAAQGAGSGGALLSSKSFLVVWLGQVISALGTGLTHFAMTIWVYKETQSVTQVALISFFISVPSLLTSPFAGALVDRWDRRWVMIASDFGSGLASLAIAILLFTHHLAVWQVYICTAVSAFCATFQWPAYSAALTLLVPKRDLGRANGMVQAGQGLAQLLSPVLAGLLVVTLGVSWVILIDFLTFLVAVTTLLFVRFPKPPVSTAGAQAAGSLWKEAGVGLSYIRAHPGLKGLLLLFASSNFFQGFVVVLAAPFVLAFSTSAVFGVVSSVAGCGMLAGALLMSVWGGPKKRVYGILASMVLSGVCIAIAGAFSSPVVFAIAGFGFFLCIPIAAGLSQTIWQSKVEPDLQGRVFAIRMIVATASMPVAFLLAGPLVDHIFEPLMAAHGALSGSLGQWIGVGPGHGIGLFFILIGSCTVLVAALGYLSRRVRCLEEEVPDTI